MEWDGMWCGGEDGALDCFWCSRRRPCLRAAQFEGRTLTRAMV